MFFYFYLFIFTYIYINDICVFFILKMYIYIYIGFIGETNNTGFGVFLYLQFFWKVLFVAIPRTPDDQNYVGHFLSK